MNHWELSKADVRTNEIRFLDPEGNEFALPITEEGLFSQADLAGVKGKGMTRLVPAFEDVRIWHLGLTLAAMELGFELDKAKIEMNQNRFICLR